MRSIRIERRTTASVESIPSRAIRRFALFVGAGLVVACVWHVSLAMQGVPYPWNTFLFLEADRFNDWHNSVASARGANPYFARSRAIPTYFPFTYVVLALFSGLPRLASTLAYLAISLTLLAGAIVSGHQCWAPSRRAGPDRFRLPFLILACVLSYPVIFALDRGNLDVWIASLCLIHLATLGTRWQLAGIVCLAIAAAFKGYPIIFLALAIAQRNWGAALGCAAIAALLTVVPLLFLWDGLAFNLNGLLLNLQRFHHAYVVGPNSLFASSDPYNGLRTLAILTSGPRGVVLGEPAANVPAWSASILRVYVLASSAFAVLCLYFVVAVPAPRWRRVTAICLAAILFPNVANDYKLTILLPGLIALLLEREPLLRGRAATVLFALLMIPKAYVVIDGRSLSLVLNPGLLIALALVVMVDGRAWRRSVRLLRFRLIWLAAAWPGGPYQPAWMTRGKPVTFLRRDHRSMVLSTPGVSVGHPAADVPSSAVSARSSS